jgi:putative mRNA 3-end processing factor
MYSLFTIDQGKLLIKSLSLYLDARKRQQYGYISHAHSDHIANHHKIVCSPATFDLIRLRLKHPKAHILSFNEIHTLENLRLKLLPAGHILGSSQIFIETEKQTMLYTGDFRLKQSRTAEPFVYQKSDILIMESTFGLPRYRFPKREEVEQRLLDIVRSKLKEGTAPIVFAYSLGKGQEVLHLLSHSGLPLAVDYPILKYVDVYRKYGIRFGPYEKLRKSTYRDKVLLLPIHMRRNRFVASINNKYMIYLSGWAMDENAAARFRVDLVLPYSDHADYDELLELVARVAPQKIFCTHGFDQFVDILNTQGDRASPLFPKKQLELFK